MISASATAKKETQENVSNAREQAMKVAVKIKWINCTICNDTGFNSHAVVRLNGEDFYAYCSCEWGNDNED